jgi:signal transduction histidine kinase
VSTTTLVRAILAAATSTSTGIALSAKRSVDEVQRQLSPAIRWLTARLEGIPASSSEESTPIIAQEYVDRLRSHLLRELVACEQLDAREIVRVLALLEELSEAWKQTDRGKFMARLTGSEGASAVVAIAHDIRSPLSSILILVESLRRGRGAVTNPIHERQLGLIYGATQGLATLASDLIDAARGEELVDEDARPFSLADTMHSVGAIVQPIAEEKGLQLHIENSTSAARTGHAAPLHRVLLNLTSNALRYTDLGSVTLGCREASSGRVAFWVQDTGRGLPPRVQQTLFDAFRPEQVSLRFSSAGLGFATVRALLAAMGSKLAVETREHRGTRLSFELELPVSPR